MNQIVLTTQFNSRDPLLKTCEYLLDFRGNERKKMIEVKTVISYPTGIVAAEPPDPGSISWEDEFAQ